MPDQGIRQLTDASEEDWEDIVSFYRDMIDWHEWELQPLADFVTWLASGQYRHQVLPSTSHAALGLSVVPSYGERLKQPMVYVELEPSGGFRLHWQQGQGNTLFEEVVSNPQAPEVFERILDWLEVAHG